MPDLHQAIYNHEFKTAKELIKSDPKAINMRDHGILIDGNSALHLAVLGQNISLIKIILDKMDPAMLDFKNQEGETALHLASQHEYTEGLKALISAGADPHAKDNYDWSPLMESAKRNHISAGEILLEAIGTDLSLEDFKEALQMANKKTKVFLVKKKIDQLMNDKTATDKEYEWVLQYVLHSDYYTDKTRRKDIAKRLLKEKGLIVSFWDEIRLRKILVEGGEGEEEVKRIFYEHRIAKNRRACHRLFKKLGRL